MTPEQAQLATKALIKGAQVNHKDLRLFDKVFLGVSALAAAFGAALPAEAHAQQPGEEFLASCGGTAMYNPCDGRIAPKDQYLWSFAPGDRLKAAPDETGQMWMPCPFPLNNPLNPFAWSLRVEKFDPAANRWSGAGWVPWSVYNPPK